MKAMEMNVGKESRIELKRKESGSPCDAFLLFHIMFLLFQFGVWNILRGQPICVVIDGSIRAWLYFLIFTVLLSLSLI